MSLTNKIHIGFQNDLGGKTLVSDRTVDAAFPIENLTNQEKGSPARWDASAFTTLQLRYTSATAYKANGFFLKGHNLTEDATIQVILHADENYSGTESDTGALTVKHAIPWGEMIAGIDQWAGHYDDASKLDTIFTAAFDGFEYKSVTINISEPNPVNDIVELDKIALCYMWSPNVSVKMGVVKAIEELMDEVTITRAGGIFVDELPRRRSMSVVFGAQSDSGFSQLFHILEKTGMGSDLYVMLNPNSTGFEKYVTGSFFRRTNRNSGRRFAWNLNEQELALLEN